MVPGAKCLLIRYFKTCFKISTALGDYFYKPELHVSRGSPNIHIKFGGGGGGIEQLLKKTIYKVNQDDCLAEGIVSF